jgi:hypothetical protein
MKRRHFVASALIPLSGSVMASTQSVQNLNEVLQWLDSLQSAKSVQSTNGWTLNAVLEHLAQSIEMSMDGFPEPKSAFFQATAGSAAFAIFKMRGRMSHGLSEPIPGAPALQQLPTWQTGAARLRAAVTKFQNYSGAMKPHFAYGSLSHADFAIAHTLHIANHQDKINLA